MFPISVKHCSMPKAHETNYAAATFLFIYVWLVFRPYVVRSVNTRHRYIWTCFLEEITYLFIIIMTMIRLLSDDEFRLVRLKTRRHYNPKGKTFQLLIRSLNVPPVSTYFTITQQADIEKSTFSNYPVD